MAGSVNFSNQQWLVQSLDQNKNGMMDELKFAPGVKQEIDQNQDNQISKAELTQALQSDRVEIQQGQVSKSRGFNVFVNGLETLKSVRATANSGVSNTHHWTPNFYSDDTSRDRYHKLVDTNTKYDGAIDKMESSLRSIRDMTEGKTDSTSRSLNIQAKTTLQSTQWKTWTARFQQNTSQTRIWFDDYKPGVKPPTPSSPSNGSHTNDPFAGGNNSIGSDPHGKDPFAGGGKSTDPHGKDPFAGGGGSNSNDPYGKDPFDGGGNNQPVIPNDPYLDRLTPHIREQEQILTNLQSSYDTMNNTLKAIKEQTNDLPDLQQSASATDAKISQAFANLTGIENSGKTPQQVASNIRSEADQTDSKATGRTGPFAGIGAGVGLVAGAAIGYFAGGQSIKNAAIGAGIGAAASAGVGALIGNGIDSGYKSEATSLRSLAGRVESYSPAADKQTTLQSNQQFYGNLFEARDAHDLDAARVVNNNISSIQNQVSPVVERSAEILNAHRKY